MVFWNDKLEKKLEANTKSFSGCVCFLYIYVLICCVAGTCAVVGKLMGLWDPPFSEEGIFENLIIRGHAYNPG